CMQGTHWPP
nr:immunoglobulin light chain junction region [Homo sapiens]